MSKFIIQGGTKLQGEIPIAGMKNAATPMLAACLLTKEECVLKNVPRIADVEAMLAIIRSVGAQAAWTGDHELTVCASQVDPTKLDQQAVRALRSSVLLAAPLLIRAGVLDLPEPGGCIIGNRPLDTHLAVFEAMGVAVERLEKTYHFKGVPRGTTIVLPEFSVTATENALMAAVRTAGTTVIKLAAAEPHVQELCAFLQKMGARISGVGTHTLAVAGVSELHGAQYAIIPDQIEIGTFAALAAATRSTLTLRPVIAEHLESVLIVLKRVGVRYELGIMNHELGIGELKILLSPQLQSFKVQAMPYPGFPTDLQAPFAVLATQAQGTSLIHDPLFEGRMAYVHELVKMGAQAIVADPHRVIISGPTPLYGQEIQSLDLRAGATLVIAGLVAQGTTTLAGAEVIDRGYERLEERLRVIGAKIERLP